MNEWESHKSKTDPSVNFVKKHADGGMVETRHVWRESKYYIIYLSTHTGCNKACRFCHLTQTRQTTMTALSVDEIVEQADIVFNYRNTLPHISKETSEFNGIMYTEANRVNFNFMARGEPLASKTILEQSPELLGKLASRAIQRGMNYHFNISSIFPEEMQHVNLVDVFGYIPNVRIYYSLYSLDETFRKRWLPKAIPPDMAFAKLAEYQKLTGAEIVFHWAFIKGENDSIHGIQRINEKIESWGLKVRFNRVRYNPYSLDQGEETDVEQSAILSQRLLTVGVRYIDRVGFDVKASCGMFMEPELA